ncbi:hypothetical protein SAFG77S_10092 [Streptomyces afghaniensis]
MTKEFTAYHIVTNKKMKLGQIINFDEHQKILYTISFLKKNN